MKHYPTKTIIRQQFVCTLFALVSLLIGQHQLQAQTTLYNLSDLTNETLLKQAGEILNTAQFEYQKELRKYYNQERVYQASNRQLDQWQALDSTFKKPTEELTTLEVATLYTNHITKLLNNYRQKSVLQENKYQALQDMVIQIDALSFSSNKSKNDLISLTPYLFEIKLRLDDGTLKSAQVPETLSQGYIKAKQQALTNTTTRFKTEVKTIKEKIAQLTKQMAKNKEAITKTELQLLTAQEKQSNAQKNSALKNTYANLTPKKLLRTFAELSEASNWIKSTYNVAYQKVTSLAKTTTASFKSTIKDKPLTFKDSPSTNDPEEAVKALDKLLKQQESQVKSRAKLQEMLKTLASHQEAFKGEATVMNEQVAKMVFVAQLIKNLEQEGKVNPQSVLAPQWHASIIAEEEKLAKQNAEVLALGQQRQKELEQITHELTNLKIVQEKLTAQKNDLQRQAKSLAKVRKWRTGLENMAPAKLIAAFDTLTNQLSDKQRLLESYYKKYKKSEDTTKNLKRELYTLKGPLFRQIRRTASEDKYGIRVKLYALINKKAFRNEPQIVTTTQASDSLPTKANASTEGKKPLFRNIAGEKYQNLLAQKIATIQKRKHLKDSLAKSLETLLTHLRQFIVKRNEINDILLHQNLYAKQIKTLFSQNKIKRNEVPAKINEALKYERISSFESLTRELYALEQSIQQELKTLTETKENNALQTKFISLQKNTGNRGSFHRHLEELQEGFDEKKKKLSGNALKVSEQLAVNRLNSDNSLEDFFLGFIKSSDTKNYSKILTATYVELIQLEQQQSILKAQIHKLEKLTKLEYAEKDSIPVLLTFLKQRLDQLELNNEEAWIKIKMRLIPDKAQEIMQAFQAKTGRNIALLPSIPPSSQDSMIRVSTEALFDYHVEITAVKKWMQLLKERLTVAGIDKEIDTYASMIGELEAKNVAIHKSIEELTGHPKADLKKMDSEERPRTRLALLTFLKGKIGALRATRNHLRYKSLLYLVIKLLLIVLLAYLLIRVVRNAVNRIVLATEKAKEQDLAEAASAKQKSRTVNIFIRLFRRQRSSKEEGKTQLEWLQKAEFLPMLYFVKALVIVVIWIFAITLAVETLGFNAGAILAGLGIGGFALAFALKDILADLFGGLTLLIAKPFTVGQWILFKGSWTKVLKVGIRYSKLLRDADNKTVTVPNSMLTSSELVNLSTYSGYIGRGEVKITPQNSYEKFDLAIELIQQVFDEVSDEVKLAWIRNDGFQDYSFVIKYRYTVTAISTRNKNVTYIHTKIIERFQANNIEFAPPPTLPLNV